MCGGFHDAAGGDILIDHKVLEGYLRKLYGGKFDVSKEIEPTIWREVLRLLNEATVEGLSQSQLPPTHEQEFYKELRHSNEVFAAFKVHKMGGLMALKLTDEDGKLKSYRQWKEDIKGISNHFLNAWLKTEYNTAVIRAHNAADWRQFERNKDIMPNLRWMPTVSPNPEAEHRVFWERKLTRPIDDPFWNKHRPGNRWNCKCSLEATDEPTTPLPTDAEIRGDQPQRGLENNPGKDGQLFSTKHPYFPKNCRECGLNKRNHLLSSWFKNSQPRQNCNHCLYVDAALPFNNSNLKKFKSYDELTWEHTYHSTIGGGYVVTERNRIQESLSSNNEQSKFTKELNMCKILADNGRAVEYLRCEGRLQGYTYDVHIDGMKADLKCITGGVGNIVKYAKKALRGQGGDAVVFELPSHDRAYYEAITEAKRKCNGRILFYFSDEKILKEAKSGQ